MTKVILIVKNVLNVVFNCLCLVLAIYGFKYLGHDSKMSVLFFLNISNDCVVDECFNCCEGVLSTKLALYIFALRYVCQFMQNVDYLRLPTDEVCGIFCTHNR